MAKKITTNTYTNLIIYSAAACIECLLLCIFSVGQPLVGYTLVLLTACLASFFLSNGGSLIVASIGGLVSFCVGFPSAVFSAPAIYKLLITVIPKILLALAGGACYRFFKKRIHPVFSGIIAAFAGFVANACGVCLVLFIGSLLNDSIGSINLPETIKGIFYFFVDTGKSFVDVLVP